MISVELWLQYIVQLRDNRVCNENVGEIREFENFSHLSRIPRFLSHYARLCAIFVSSRVETWVAKFLSIFLLCGSAKITRRNSDRPVINNTYLTLPVSILANR